MMLCAKLYVTIVIHHIGTREHQYIGNSDCCHWCNVASTTTSQGSTSTSSDCKHPSTTKDKAKDYICEKANCKHGTIYYCKCKVCEEPITTKIWTDTDKTSEHDYGEWYTTSSTTYHYKKCKVCSKTQSEHHDWANAKIDTIKEPTCTAKGTNRWTCPTCGKTKDVSVNATGHTYNSNKVVNYDNKTYHKLMCDNCDYYKKQMHNCVNGVCKCGYSKNASNSTSGSSSSSGTSSSGTSASTQTGTSSTQTQPVVSQPTVAPTLDLYIDNTKLVAGSRDAAPNVKPGDSIRFVLSNGNEIQYRWSNENAFQRTGVNTGYIKIPTPAYSDTLIVKDFDGNIEKTYYFNIVDTTSANVETPASTTPRTQLKSDITKSTMVEKEMDSVKFLLYTPEKIVDGMPLIVFYTGAGESGSTPKNMLKDYFPNALNTNKIGTDAVIIMPSVSKNYDSGKDNSNLKKLLDDICANGIVDGLGRKVTVDKNKMAIIGYSRGGMYACKFVYSYKNYFKVLVLANGAYVNKDKYKKEFINCINTVCFLCGTKDSTYSGNETLYNALLKQNMDVTLQEFNCNHTILPVAFADSTWLDWTVQKLWESTSTPVK